MNNFWNDKRILVTGGTGLVGSWLIKKLIQCGSHVVALIRDCAPQSELIRSGDLQSIHVVNGELQSFAAIERAVNEHEIDTLFHLGAQTIVGTAFRNPLDTFESNIRGTYNLLEVARIHASLVKRVVIASSDKAYGASSELPYTEEMPPLGRHPYEVSKSCADLLSQSYFHTYHLPIAIARCGNIYGGGDLNLSRIIPGTIRSILEGKRPIIRSDGKMTRDYIYVKDVVNAYLCLGERLSDPKVKGEAFNFGPNHPSSVLDIVKTISLLMNRGDLEPKILNGASSEIRDQYLSSEKAQKYLKWSMNYGLEEGLRETIAWYENYLDHSPLALEEVGVCN